MNQRLTQTQRQELKLSPQQIQLMKLLQLPLIELEQRIKEEIESNPALEDTVNSDDNESTAGDNESPEETVGDSYDDNDDNGENDDYNDDEFNINKDDDVNVTDVMIVVNIIMGAHWDDPDNPYLIIDEEDGKDPVNGV